MASDNAAELLKEQQQAIKSSFPSGCYAQFEKGSTNITAVQIKIYRRRDGTTKRKTYCPPIHWQYDNDAIIEMLSSVFVILSEMDFNELSEMSPAAISEHIDNVDGTLLPSNELRSLNPKLRGVIAKLARATRGSGNLCDSVIEQEALALLASRSGNASTARSDMKAHVMQGRFVVEQPFFEALDQLATQTFSSLMAGEKTDNFETTLSTLLGNNATADLRLDFGVDSEVNDCTDVVFTDFETSTLGKISRKNLMVCQRVDSITTATAKISCGCQRIHEISDYYSPIFMPWFIKRHIGEQGRLLRLYKTGDGSWSWSSLQT